MGRLGLLAMALLLGSCGWAPTFTYVPPTTTDPTATTVPDTTTTTDTFPPDTTTTVPDTTTTTAPPLFSGCVIVLDGDPGYIAWEGPCDQSDAWLAQNDPGGGSTTYTYYPDGSGMFPGPIPACDPTVTRCPRP